VVNDYSKQGMSTSNRSIKVRSSTNPALAGRRILVAEDEWVVALEIETILLDFGCEVVGPLSSLDQVLQNAEQGGLDGALLDVCAASRFSTFCRS
jgi:hypothetical protein